MRKIIRQRGTGPRATSCRNTGRHHLGMPGRLRRNPHLDTLAVASGLLERIGTGARASDITSVFVDIARDHACRSIRAAFGFEGTRAAIAGASDISKLVLGENAPGRLQKLAHRADVDVAFLVEGEV